MSFFGGEGGFQQPPYADLFSHSSGAGNPLAYPFMPPQATKDLLKRQFGIDFPEVQQNPLLSNATAAAHPLLKLLSGAIMGGAMTPGPQAVEGAGQGMSRAMQGILGVPAARRQFQASQIQAPFQMADQVGGFQALEQIKDLRAAQTGLLNSEAGAATKNAQSKSDLDAMRLENANNRKEYLQQLADLKTQAQQQGNYSPEQVLALHASGVSDLTKVTPEQANAAMELLIKKNNSLDQNQAKLLNRAQDREDRRQHDSERKSWVADQRKNIALGMKSLDTPEHRFSVISRINNSSTDPKQQIDPTYIDEKTGWPTAAAPKETRKQIEDAVAVDSRIRSRHKAQWEKQLKSDPNFDMDFDEYEQYMHNVYAQDPKAASMAYGVPAHAIGGTAPPATPAAAPKSGDPLGLF